MLLKRLPKPALRPFIETVWVTDEKGNPRSITADREHVLPTGHMHLVFRLTDHPLRLFANAQDMFGRTIGHAIVGGARATFYVRDISEPTLSVGAQLRPGAAEALFDVPADELADHHVRLEDLWGRAATVAHERLVEVSSPVDRLDLFESLLAARLPRIHGLHPAVAHALSQFVHTTTVHELVRDSGYSHRAFIALFRRAVGLTPKVYCRVLRFQHALRCVGADASASWVNLALAVGYSDQPHFNREFREFTGVTPTEYRTIWPAFTHHLPLTRLFDEPATR